MCRFIAYAGDPTTVSALVVEPEHGLLGQCRMPRFQTRTRDNPDGYGVAWYEDGVVHRVRKPVPMWEDTAFLKRARTITTRAFIGAIRKATPGIVLGEQNTPPYVNGQYVFAHNGSVEGWVEGAEADARALVSPSRLREVEGTTDSEVMFALVLDRIDAGDELPDAVAAVTTLMGRRFGGYLNLVATDGTRIAASSWGNSLFVLATDASVVVASEPFDDDDRWSRVPDRSLVDAAPGAASVRALEEVART